jgi:tRNA modification GTPase
MHILPKDTIAAIATPRGAGGIAIIKISGPRAIAILGQIFRPVKQPAPAAAEAGRRRIRYGHIVHPDEGIIDEVLVTVMPAPHSYTTEDVVEINCHGGAVVSGDILALVLRQGARTAEPGEFTRRAFLGGRINLTQAEAVIDLINAKTRRATRAGMRHLMHGIDAKVEALQAQILDCLAEIEAYIDFDDDIEETLSIAPLGVRIETSILPMVQSLIETYREGRLLNEGLRIVIVGRPNVGKSSLVNLLLNQERVIVAATPGTTRDIIEEMIALEGAPVVITDTAGIHASGDPIEAMGIQKSREAIERADLVLFVIDATAAVQPGDKKIYNNINKKEHIVIQNKIDLCDGRPSLPHLEGLRSPHLVELSALTGEGLATLKKRIAERIGLSAGPEESAVLVNLRQRKLLEASRGHLEKAAHFLAREADAELAVVELKDALSRFLEILGQKVAPDVLDHIFQRFCIGK